MRRPGIIFDLDGTVYLGDHLIPGARETIHWLRQHDHPTVFVSNKPVQSRADYAAKLTRLDIPTRPDEVINSSLVLVRTMSREMPGAAVYAVGEPPLLESWRPPVLGSARIAMRLRWWWLALTVRLTITS